MDAAKEMRVDAAVELNLLIVFTPVKQPLLLNLGVLVGIILASRAESH